jgi:uncharacterized protein (DUF1800 family)
VRQYLLKRVATVRPVVACLLCVLCPGQSLPAQPTAIQPHPVEMDSRQRVLHLLSRFTFGPTQQDLAFFTATPPATGHASAAQDRRQTDKKIDQWFDQQLHPDRFPDRQLESRLAEFQALQLPVNELLERFPSNAEIRQTANGKLSLPQDPYLAAIYLRHVNLYEEKQAEKAEQAPQPTQMTQPMQQASAMSSSAGSAAPVAKKPAALKAATARPAYGDLLVKSVLALPPDQRLDRIVDMLPGEYDQFHASLKGPLKAQLMDGINAVQREYLHDYDNPTRTVVEELQAQRLLRDIYSTNQLQEVMTTFWLNHFNIYLHKNDEEPYYLVSYERDVIRPLALGKFEDLLVATAQSPAMLLYLDNSSSTGPDSISAEKQKERAAKGKSAKPTPPGLNENYARELMELHTLGVNGGYTQNDVTEVAKIFTGWTVDKPQLGGGFKFDESRHEPGKKTVLGHKIKEGGEKEGLQLLHILATSPATAHFISRELAITFVSDNPPPALVNRMAQTFLDKQGDIPSVLRTMLHSPEFWAAESYHAKVKTPLEYVVSAVRASGSEIANTQPLVNMLNQMGMPLYACVPPTGYSAKADEWVSTGALVTRMNFGLSLATNHFPDIHTTWNITPVTEPTNAPPSPETLGPADAELALEARLTPTGISAQTRTAVLSQSADAAQQQKTSPRKSNQSAPSTSAPVNPDAQAAATRKAAAAREAMLEKQDAQLAGLLLGSPEFQRR